MDLSDRQLNILKAIVKDYIETAEAVGSRTISKKYSLGVSAATIRNEMSDLEDMGYLVQLILLLVGYLLRRDICCMLIL